MAPDLLGISLLLSVWVLPLAAQPGFLSIDSGLESKANYTGSDGITWVNDKGYIQAGFTSGQIATYQGSWSRSCHDFRFFNDSGAKNCYELPVESNRTYLIRASFLWGNFSKIAANVSFDLTVNSTKWTTVNLFPVQNDRVDLADGYTVPLTTEIIVRSMGSRVDVCLIRRTGVPFISSLELRPLADDMYVDVMNNKVLVNQWRWRIGACCPSDLRYQEDPYDRIWYVYGGSLRSGNDLVDRSLQISNFDKSQQSTQNTTMISSAVGMNWPPVQVMMDAWTFNGSVNIYQPMRDISSDYYMALYFQEILKDVQTGARKFGLLLNGKLLEEITPNSTAYGFISTRNIAEGFANFSMVKASSESLNPMVNAMEMYSVFDLDNSSTNIDDVAALDGVRSGLGLLEWSGDPCHPIPWEWLSCSTDQPSRVTQLKLSKLEVAGSIPSDVKDLTALIDLWLDHNQLEGRIPDLRNLTQLQTLHLQNNNLSGEIPASLAELPFLQELYLDNNSLSAVVPLSLLQLLNVTNKNFTFTFSGNRLCLPGNESCLGGSYTQVPSAAPSLLSSSGNGSKSKVGVIVGAVFGSIGAIVAFAFAFIIVRKKSKRPAVINRDIPREASGVDLGQSKQAKVFLLEEVEEMTNNFSHKIGEGSFGSVYHGTLPDGQVVAVKVNSAHSNQGSAEFINEVVLLSRVHHKNLVSLVGYCQESNQQILVYAYMAHGTLGDHLYRKKGYKALTWRQRLDIALNAAQGLDYLHTFCSPPIIHRDVKPNNILLDERMMAKVADFGMSKSGPEGSQAGFSTAIKGTFGYLDPEYFSGRQRLTQKSDVYSFGIVLLELITGFKPTSVRKLPDGREMHLNEWTRCSQTPEEMNLITDPAMTEDYNPEAVWKVAEIAWACLEPRGAERPDMGEVIQGLMVAIQVEFSRLCLPDLELPSPHVRWHASVPPSPPRAPPSPQSESPSDPMARLSRITSGDSAATWDSQDSSAYHPR